MTTLSVKDEINQVVERIKAKFPSYRERYSQKVMFSEIARTLWNAQVQDDDTANPVRNIIAIEAPTGTGKSQGYLVPSILIARRKGKKVIVSSATVKLQQQLCESELPLMNECIEGGVTYAIAKGRSRYVCPLKLEKEAGAASQGSLMAESNGGNTDARDSQIITFQDKWRKGAWDGDRDSVKVDDTLWADISTNASGCTGSRCSKAKGCPFFVARARLDKVDVIVANHDLLLSDLSLGGGVILPAPEDSYYMIDEAHHLPEKTLSAFAASFSIHSTLKVIEKLSIDNARSMQGSLTHNIHTKSEQLFDYLNDLAVGLESMDSLKEKGDVLRFPFGALPDSFVVFGRSIFETSSILLDRLNDYIEEINESINTSGTNAKVEKELMEASMNYERVEAVYKTWLLMLSNATPGQPPVAKWLEVTAHGRDLDFKFSASPVTAGHALKEAFWDKALSVVLTSATLTALNSFEMFSSQSGISLIPERTKSIALPTPFDYATQGTLVMPKMQFSPKDVVGHTAEVIKILPLIYPERGGMLVLFASKKQMNEVRDAMPESIKAVTMAQGDMSLTEILNEHKKRVGEGKVSTIFGLNSLAEGVDLPADLCLRVVIVKLPFDVPNDPIGKTYSEWLESMGRNSFNEVALTSASRKLNQHSGRLIRRETDVGTIYCLDNRLAKSKYGNDLINALPPYKIEKNVEVV